MFSPKSMSNLGRLTVYRMFQLELLEQNKNVCSHTKIVQDSAPLCILTL
jgi:hypothetical protein